jgi:carbon-monoxide dehydrogenase large subunit
VEQYYIVEDCGTILDHDVVEGQVQGAVAQGMGNALLEALVYDVDGQLLTASLLDYLVPTALDIPPLHTAHMETPSPFTFNGVKGVGEAGTVGAYAAIPNAVADALRALGHCRDGVAPQSPAGVGAGPSGSAAACHGSPGGPGRYNRIAQCLGVCRRATMWGVSL